MAYSIMVWLVDPGKHPHEQDEIDWVAAGQDEAPGARTGENMGHALPRMAYGVYDTEGEAEQALEEISSTLQKNAPLKINNSHSHRVWLIPADRVHYVVCSQVDRPKD